MTSMMLADLTLETLTPSVNAPLNEHFQNFERPKMMNLHFIVTCSSDPCFFWYGLILCCSQSGHDWQENFATFGYNLNMKVN
jgi:hypothetical protein